MWFLVGISTFGLYWSMERKASFCLDWRSETDAFKPHDLHKCPLCRRFGPRPQVASCCLPTGIGVGSWTNIMALYMSRPNPCPTPFFVDVSSDFMVTHQVLRVSLRVWPLFLGEFLLQLISSLQTKFWRILRDGFELWNSCSFYV